MVPKDFTKMTKSELLKLAKEMKLNVTAGMRKSELAEAVRRGLSSKKETPAATGRLIRGSAKGAAKEKATTGRRRAATARTAGAKTATVEAAKAPGGRAKPKKAAQEKAAGAIRAARVKATVRATRAAGKARATRAAAQKGEAKTARKAEEPKKPAPEKGAKSPERAKPPERIKPPAAREKRIEAATIRQEAVASKYYLGAEEKVMPPVESLEVPREYGMDRIAAMVRDPYWIFTYWEVTGDRMRDLERLFGDEWPRCRMILRVHDRSAEPETHFDIEITGEARTWYINVAPERTYQVAIGALCPGGRFEQVALSNIVETPRYGVSDVIDDRWMVPEDVFDRIFAASGGYDMHASSEELRALLEKRLLEQISSGAVSSFVSGIPPREELGRGFRLWVATELILYGATEPDARVTVRGEEVKLRGDGTFSLRFALPDGKIDLPVTAASADGVEERTIETTVKKASEQKEPVLR